MQSQQTMLSDSAVLRDTMVERQIRTFDVTDAGVLSRMKTVPRELFVDPPIASLAYSDARLTISGTRPRELTAPLILAKLLKEAHLSEADRVLVVAGATGYAAALIAGLAASVVSLDDDESLAARAEANFAALGLANAKSLCGPLEKGAPDDAPFDLILVDGVSQGEFSPFIGQLREDGRLVAIVSKTPGARVGRATLFRRAGDNLSARPVFEAAAGSLSAFAKPPQFLF